MVFVPIRYLITGSKFDMYPGTTKIVWYDRYFNCNKTPTFLFQFMYRYDIYRSYWLVRYEIVFLTSIAYLTTSKLIMTKNSVLFISKYLNNLIKNWENNKLHYANVSTFKKKKIINYYTLRPLCPLNLISPTWPITTVIIWVCLSIIPIKQIILYIFV